MELIKSRENALIEWFKIHPKIIVALSGGVDSCLVAFIARKTLPKSCVVAVTGVSPSLKNKDLLLVRDFCAQFDIQLTEINPKEIEDSNYLANPINRCFYCKTALYGKIQDLKKGELKTFYVVNGSNVSDTKDYRPGVEAADNFSVRSPLAECNFTKQDIRELAKKHELPVWDKPASPCLSSRFPYGESISVEKLQRVGAAEDILNDFGFRDVRVRYLNNSARIEVPENEIELLQKDFRLIEEKIMQFGFNSCEIDDEGLVSGKLNRAINK